MGFPKTGEDFLQAGTNVGRGLHKLHDKWFKLAWGFWLILTILLLVCLLPLRHFTTIITPQMTLRTKRADANWMKFTEDGLQLLSYFSEDLGKYSGTRLKPDFFPISQNVYKFDFVGMCRISTISKKAVCHYGPGFDVVSNIITDIGVQVGTLGLIADPQEFGQTLNHAYKFNLHALNDIVRETNKNPDMADLDSEKLAFVSRLMASEILGKLLMSVWIAHFLCSFFLGSLQIFHYVSVKRGWSVRMEHKTYRRAFLLLLTCCFLTSVWTWSLETGFLLYMNSVLKSYGVYFTFGLGYIFIICQIVIEVFLAWMVLSQ